jgi:hypothetical protein
MEETVVNCKTIRKRETQTVGEFLESKVTLET